MDFVAEGYYQWGMNAAAALLVGLTKAGFGGGANLLTVPLMALTLGGDNMLAVMLLLLIGGDICSIGRYPRAVDRRNIVMLIPGCIIGVGLGSMLLSNLRGQGAAALELGLARLIGGICILFIIIQLWRFFRESRLTGVSTAYRPRVWEGVMIGAAAGVTSTLAHAGGPLITLFLLPQRLDKRVFVGTTLVFFFVGNLIKLWPFAAQGLFTAERAATSFVLMPAVFVGTVIGAYLNRRMNARHFVLVIYAVALITGIKLLTARPETGAEHTEAAVEAQP